MAVREIDELYDVYLDIKQHWDTKVGHLGDHGGSCWSHFEEPSS